MVTSGPQLVAMGGATKWCHGSNSNRGGGGGDHGWSWFSKTLKTRFFSLARNFEKLIKFQKTEKRIQIPNAISASDCVFWPKKPKELGN